MQGTAEVLAEDIGVPINDTNYICAGINHLVLYLKFERNGEDLYSKIRRAAEAKSYAHGHRNLAAQVQR